MAKKPLTDEELLAQFESLDNAPATKHRPAAAKKDRPAATASATASATANPAGDDPLAELESLAKKPASRPATPLAKVAARASDASARNSEDGKAARAQRKSSESARSLRQGLTPTSEEERQARDESSNDASGAAATGWGGWLSGITAAATAAATTAAKQAEAYAKEIQKNDEAQKWTEQLKGRVGDLRGLGDDLRSRALPTFTNILNTIAPPISSHERLQIHITHDLVGYPSLDPTIYAVFSRVMSQVEGGDLLVIQRGSEASHRRPSDGGFRGRGGPSGWNDGPWWRDGHVKRDLGIVHGLKEGTKLARVSAEAYSKDFFDARGGIEQAAEHATKALSQTNPVRSSDVFLAIQAVGFAADAELFASAPEENKEGGPQDEVEKDELVVFAVYLHDPVHGISFHTLSQPFPRRWAQWTDAENDPSSGEGQLPEEILDIIQAGGVDPREWVAEWFEEIISTSVGVVAQRYVARRMGVGEGGIGRGKKRAEEIVDGAAAGEAARAGVI